MLKYIGPGWLPGVPARDLHADEAEQFGREFLLSTGLYVHEDEEVDEESPQDEEE